ncbi:MAG TPA: chloride channel protein, partial [bacterium]
PRSLVPVALACAMAAAFRPYVMGPGVLFPVSATAVSNPWVLLAAAGSGIIAGAFSTFLTHALYKVEDTFGTLKIHWMWWPAMAGVVVGIGGYLRPRAFGVGYDVIEDLLHLKIPLAIVVGLIAVKCIIWLVSLGSGTSGGVLAPLLMMGAALGVVEAQVFPGDPMLWPLVSMSAILGGMMRVPFCAVIFGLELTYDLDALPALFIAAVTAYGFTVLVMRRSILTEKVARRGYDLFREYVIDPLERVRISEVMTRELETIPAHMPVAEALERYFAVGRKHRGYPVVEGDGMLVGMVTVSDLVALTNGDLAPKMLMRDVVPRAPVVGHPEESCRLAAERMAEDGVGRLPVVEPGPKPQLVGIVTRSDLLKPRLAHVVEEQQRERIFLRRPA